jgi:hypothetical protein
MNHTTTLTAADRAEALAIAASTQTSHGYKLARQFLDRAAIVRPRGVWHTCTIEHVRQVMAQATGHTVTSNEMALALADAGFVARELDGEAVTNVRRHSLARALREGVALTVAH